MKTYLISYISNSGIPCLNIEVEDTTQTNAIQQIKGTEGVRIILSCVSVK